MHETYRETKKKHPEVPALVCVLGVAHGDVWKLHAVIGRLPTRGGPN